MVYEKRLAKELLPAAITLLLALSLSLPQVSFASPPEAASDVLTRFGDAMARLSEKVKPSIVNISTSKTVKTPRLQFNDPLFRKFFGEGQPQKRKVISLGSGIIASSDGHIVTCGHVVEGAEDIVVKLNDGRELKGKIVGLDSKTDIAIIKINADNLPTIAWGDSGKLKTGDLVVAIGNPYGLSQTVTMGIVSATGRAGMGLTDYEDFIQTDAAINPGNSGGALVNSKGELVGVNDAIFSTSGGNQGIGFAIPSNMAKNIMNSIISQGKVIRGYLGVQVQQLTPDIARQFGLKDEKGVLVVDVTGGGPAEAGGLKRGDVIVSFNGKDVENAFQLKNIVASTTPGKSVQIGIVRDGKPLALPVTITELAAEAGPAPAVAEASDNALKGVAVQDLNRDILAQLGITREIQGVIVTNVDENSRALGVLKKGDIIMEINRKAVRNSSEYKGLVSKISKKDDILLLIMRDGYPLYITLGGQ